MLVLLSFLIKLLYHTYTVEFKEFVKVKYDNSAKFTSIQSSSQN